MTWNRFCIGLLSYFAFFCFWAALSGCAAEPTAFDAARIVTVPSGAEVVDVKTGTVLGTTPLELTWERTEFRAEYVILQLSKDEYQQETATFFMHPDHESKDDALEQAQVITTQLTLAQ